MNTAQSIFEFQDYKSYLTILTGSRQEHRGMKTAFAKALNCQPTYISQVLNGTANLSQEQADSLNRFLGHNKDESLYFLLLVQRERAGTQSLRDFISSQLEEVLKKRLQLTRRLGERSLLSAEQRSIYYSSWHYAAIHIGVTIPGACTHTEISRYLGIPFQRAGEVLNFLCEIGLLKKQGNAYQVGHNQIRLGNDSHDIIKHHTHWRNQAIESLEREDLSDLHYSGVASLSKTDALRIKDRLLEDIKKSASVIRNSNEEELYCYCVDFFSLRRDFDRR